MRSIRFSLILYFLLLFGAVLGAVALLCYQNTQHALAAKEKSTQELLIKKFDEDKAAIIAKFDTRVRARGREIAAEIVQYDNRMESLNVLSVIGTTMYNGGVMNMTLPLGELFTPLGVRLSPYRSQPRVQGPHAETEPYQSAVKEDEYYQVYAPAQFFGPPQKLGNPAVIWPMLHESSHGELGSFGWELSKVQKAKADQNEAPLDDANLKLDDTKLRSGQMKVRRLTLKVYPTRRRHGVVVPLLPELEKQFKGPLLPMAGEIVPKGMGGARPYVYLQFAIDTASRDQDLANGAKNLTADLDKLAKELEESRVDLGMKLLWISLGAFAALVVGGFWLVPHGLKPLNRLSDAVSKVSEKDFRLPIDEQHLPEELKPIAGRMADTLEQLKRAFEREKQAAADISHELRTPVAALLTTLDIALRKPRSAEEYREVLEDCRSNGQQINQVVERLLTLARLDAGADLLRPRDVDVSVLADQCVALVRPLAEARGLHLIMHSNGPAATYADPDKVREVLTNLLHNAIAYNKPDGSIDVQVERRNGSVAMEVRDTGIGISPEARKRIFERFYRVDPSRHADDSPHAGLGLAIVKGYVDLMGGSIDVDSAEGQGTTFRVLLPVR